MALLYYSAAFGASRLCFTSTSTTPKCTIPWPARPGVDNGHCTTLFWHSDSACVTELFGFKPLICSSSLSTNATCIDFEGIPALVRTSLFWPPSSLRPACKYRPVAPQRLDVYQVQLPWYSVPPHDFPRRERRNRRRKPPLLTPSLSLELPPEASSNAANLDENGLLPSKPASLALGDTDSFTEPPDQFQEPVRCPTPATSQSPSETGSTQPTTPSSLPRPRSSQPSSSTRQVGKIVPAVPVLNHPQRNPRQAPVREKAPSSQEPAYNTPSTSTSVGAASVTPDEATTATSSGTPTEANQNAVPKSWADLVKSKTPKIITTNGESDLFPEQRLLESHVSRPRTLAEVLKQISNVTVRTDKGTISPRPRGLVNTGNMCYMNSVSYSDQVTAICSSISIGITGVDVLCTVLRISEQH